MRNIVHRHLGKMVAGTTIAVAGTAVMVAVTLPGTAGADDTGTRAGRSVPQVAGDAAAGGRRAVAPGVVEAAPAEGQKGQGRDPLTDDELKRVEKIALSRQLFQSSESVDGERGPQRLGIDLAEPEADEAGKPDAPRRADVTFYDYRDDTLVTRTVDLGTGKVVATGTQHGVQPPLSRAEKAEAAGLLVADPLGSGLKADYQDATGKALTSPDQLQLSGAVYRAAPGAQPAVLDRCGEHRCVRLFPKIKNGPWVDARSLVIDLSARKVARLGR
ncbi:Tat pathway signal sequence domain protein [Streptomyces hawaiiensis]|uniref:Tat pathway signal sequence domain protein n=1 Tax=Streptomyces hawaiiensis TaxID=67305 RepID=A0A6G5RL96_9ACTN|nr:Tat pathway signal sequence domain protein [Streptomyces hawaiiensis]QCD58928.1 Tat pathway signal sequence domain protein [Streptomyces hawaiiensis]